MDQKVTPLLELLRKCSVDEQHRLAALAGTKRNYLYQLAQCNRKSCRTALAAGIAKASVTLSKETRGRTPVITVEQLGSMCQLP